MVDVALDVLRNPAASLQEVMRALTILDRSTGPFTNRSLGIAANVSVDLLATFLRRHAYLAGIHLTVNKGNYDDLLEDCATYSAQKCDYAIILPFFDNLLPSWEAQLAHSDMAVVDGPADDYLSRLAVALDQTPAGSLIVAGAHAWRAQVSQALEGAEKSAIARFNRGISTLAGRYRNVQVLDTGSVLSRVGTRHAFDERFYYRGKSPYSAAFLDEFSRHVALMTRDFGTRYHKVLALDCDNTLWGGIIGEDGISGIKLDPYSFPGNIFWTVQHQILTLEQHGVLVCLCSKNNPADVDEVLRRHPNCVLGAERIVARKVNWNEKVDNLQALAGELNLGLDSFIFVDDSSFEIEAVRARLPMVRAFQVPQRLPDYPAMFDTISALFLAGGVSDESRSKTDQYRQFAAAAAEQEAFTSKEDYLRSLALKVTVFRNATEQIPRISELTMKSNQFNLTTHRISPGELVEWMARNDASVFSFSVADRFGDCGITGVLIVQFSDATATVDTFLMSCRVIGRGVEFSIWQVLVDEARSRNIRLLEASYIPSAKNAQVADFYDQLGLTLTNERADGARLYEVDLATFSLPESSLVELIDG